MTDAMIERAERIIREYDAQGDHRTGTAVDDASAAWLAEQVRAADTEPSFEPFALDRVEPTVCFLEIGGRRLDGLPKFDGGTTDARGISGSLGPLGSDATVVLLETTPSGEYDATFVRALEDGMNEAYVVVTGGGLPGLAPVNAARFTRPYAQPILQLSSTHAATLRAQADAHAPVRLVAQIERVPTKAVNVTARVVGTDATKAPLVVMTPRSGWWNCASERGGGLVCWLETLRAVASTALPRTVYFTANSGHELGHLGLHAAINNQPELPHGAYSWLHFGASIGARGSQPVLQCSSNELRDLALDVLARHDLPADNIIGPGQSPGGEARNIYTAGGQYLSSVGRGNAVFHHPADRSPEWPDVELIARLATAWAEIAVRLASNR